MAEFHETMRQAARMCAAHQNDCTGCGLYREGISCPFESLPEGWPVNPDRLMEIGRVVMDWAASHPEPRYPSWQEAWVQLFPDAREGRTPCPAYFISRERVNAMCGDCRRCLAAPMPPDVAERLGIKPFRRSE